ncbi:hemogen isoform X1 [Syngnathus scovelli]|uniref:hemogen isoform X1 n=1 Tax=Syngnathus scovelli TaxID=161590 RepID=UPI0021102BCA|nr:hemogen isoform X1 [Syngnathus scovelli]XP_049576300.1 hemogen isoform X1 [Syngnathus scovelli]XP_049576302.1 hemogen isoform X1 [Syngnathus scovelli]XP_049576303.1 hemogen isoform X1 [Syngnathus scovelli]XP_049576304.1 hemogen isoform X1 [Syngnathus scovelli]XP_049576305.1 hemogen isoform X1 [Syngnathus scovelli]XP_049576306.1 hemogen isoform X1 [Syngnathus scovelli]
MEETLQQEYEGQNEEDQGGIRRRLRDRELLKRKRAEAEQKETHQWVLGLESLGKRQKYDQRRSTKRRGRPKKTDGIAESSQVGDSQGPAVLVLPQPALGLDSLPTVASGSLETVSTWSPNPVLTPLPNVAVVSPPDLVPPPITAPPDVYPTAVLPDLAQDPATVSAQTSSTDLAQPPSAVLPDRSTAPDQALASDSVPLAPVQDLSTASAQSSFLDPDLVVSLTTVPLASTQAPVQYSAPDLVPASDVLIPTPSQATVAEVVEASTSAPQRVENLSTESQGKENLDLVLIEDLGPDQLENDVPPTQDKKAEEDGSQKLSNYEAE